MKAKEETIIEIEKALKELRLKSINLKLMLSFTLFVDVLVKLSVTHFDILSSNNC